MWDWIWYRCSYRYWFGVCKFIDAREVVRRLGGLGLALLAVGLVVVGLVLSGIVVMLW